MSRLIFHVDVNSAFLSWEAAKRVAEGYEDIRLIPSAIGGDRNKRTGVILAKSVPAKAFNIRTGEPVDSALRKCPNLYLAKPDFKLYEKSSRAFMDICRNYAPIVEKYSIDECFLDMSGTEKLYPDPVAIAYEIKDKIRDTLGFTVNIGIGNNKLLAKMAGDFEKPDKVHTLFECEIKEKIWFLPVDELFTVGHSTAEKLKKSYINTIGDLANTDIRRVQSIVGNKLGLQLHRFANGNDDSPVLAEPEEAKGYSISTTLEADVRDAATAKQILLSLADSVTSRMRADNFKTMCVAITIRSNDFKNRSHQRRLWEPTDITSEVYEIAVSLFTELWDGYTPLRLLGIALTNITQEQFEQICLFRDKQKDRARKVDKTIDSIRSKFGMDAISMGTSLQSPEVGRKYKAQLENGWSSSNEDV